jgi:hypothetical protein
VAGIRVTDALDSAAGRALLASLSLSDKTKPLGLPPGDMESLVLGVNAKKLPPRLTAVVRLKTALDESRIHAVLGSEQTVEQHGKTLRRGRLWPNGPEGVVWQADSHTLIAAQLPEDFDRVPTKPHAAVPLPDLMERLDPSALAWLVASPDANDAAVTLVTPFVPPAERDAWMKLQAIALSLRAEGSRLTLTAHILGRNATAGEAIAKSVVESLTKVGVRVERSSSADWQNVLATADSNQLGEVLHRPAAGHGP